MEAETKPRAESCSAEAGSNIPHTKQITANRSPSTVTASTYVVVHLIPFFSFVSSFVRSLALFLASSSLLPPPCVLFPHAPILHGVSFRSIRPLDCVCAPQPALFVAASVTTAGATAPVAGYDGSSSSSSSSSGRPEGAHAGPRGAGVEAEAEAGGEYTLISQYSAYHQYRCRAMYQAAHQDRSGHMACHLRRILRSFVL